MCGDVKLLIRNQIGEFGLAAYAGTQMYLSFNAIPFLVSCSLAVHIQPSHYIHMSQELFIA